MERVTDWLKERRVALGLTLLGVSQFAGVSLTAYHRVERLGMPAMREERLRDVAGVLGVDGDELVWRLYREQPSDSRYFRIAELLEPVVRAKTSPLPPFEGGPDGPPLAGPPLAGPPLAPPQAGGKGDREAGGRRD